MSEYQYYEWQTIDRALTAAEQAAVGKLSSHIEVTSTRAWLEYQWSGFRHDPLQVLARHFDAFLYYANWGGQQLAFRFPKGLLDEAALQPYLWEDCAELKPIGDTLILDIRYPDEDGGHGYEDEARLSGMASLRDDILAGDHRVLYLTWLLAASANDIDEELEPPVPPGLDELSAPLTEFVRFFELDPFLVQAAAQASAPLAAGPARALATRIPLLSRAECDDFLRRLVDGEPLLVLKLKRRLQELAGPATAPPSAAPRRTWSELHALAKQLRHGAKLRQQAEAEAQRLKDLQDFAPRAPQAWREVERLLEEKTARAYDEALALLVKLRDLAVFQHQLPEFKTRLDALKARYAKRTAFQERLRKARLA
ncbi:MAG: hypothetical protein IPK16_29565 [Anaerolineales bacterium]|nr:hypothetical protein [Anaerolineales bacterium]